MNNAIEGVTLERGRDATKTSRNPPIALDPMALAAQWGEWKAGVGQEVAFWSRWIAQQGGEYTEDFCRRFDPNSPVDWLLEAVLQELAQPVVRLLDVGAGPVCCLGKISAHAELRITAVDPLADHYDEILAENDMRPPVRTVFGIGEDLVLQFARGSFDVVHCQNALDHSLDPVRTLLQMLEVCRIGGSVMLRHAHDEAEHENYSGLHKWNLTNEEDRFIIWDRSERRDLTAELAGFSESRILATDGYLINLFRKTSDVPSSLFAQTGVRMHNFQRALIKSLGST